MERSAVRDKRRESGSADNYNARAERRDHPPAREDNRAVAGPIIVVGSVLTIIIMIFSNWIVWLYIIWTLDFRREVWNCTLYANLRRQLLNCNQETVICNHLGKIGALWKLTDVCQHFQNGSFPELREELVRNADVSHVAVFDRVNVDGDTSFLGGFKFLIKTSQPTVICRSIELVYPVYGMKKMLKKW